MSQRILDLLESTMASHEQRYATDSDELVPMYFLYRGEQLVTIAATPFSGEPGEKSLLVQAVCASALSTGCDAYTFSAEAWTLPPELCATHDGSSMASNPARVEVLSVEAGTADGEKGALIADIIRGADGSVTLQRRPPIISGVGGASSVSRFNIFSPGDPRMRGAMPAPMAGATRH